MRSGRRDNAAGGTDNITVVIARFDATATAVL